MADTHLEYKNAKILWIVRFVAVGLLIAVSGSVRRASRLYRDERDF